MAVLYFPLFMRLISLLEVEFKSVASTIEKEKRERKLKVEAIKRKVRNVSQNMFIMLMSCGNSSYFVFCHIAVKKQKVVF